MTTISRRVTSSVTLDVKIREWLRENGYSVDSNNKISFKHEHRFIFFWRRGFRFGANLYTDKSPVNQDLSPSKKWLMEVYGRVFKEAAEECAERLSAQFNVNIHVVLETEYMVDPYPEY